MFKTTNMSFLTAVTNNSFDEFAEKFDPAHLSKNSDDDFYEGNFLVKTLPLRTSYQNLITNSRVISERKFLVDNETRPESREYYELQGNVTREIFTLNEVGDFKECINSINKIRETLNDNFFGALLIDQGKKDEIINPLHPLVSIILSEENDYTVSSKIYSIVIFTYQDRERMDRYYKTDFADKELIEENLGDLISCYFNKQKQDTKVTSTDNNRENETVQFRYKVKKSEEEIIDEEHYMVAHQIFTEGIVSPYYGTSFLKVKDGDNTGIGVSPMLSCNIAFDRSFGNGTGFNSEYQRKKEMNIVPSYNSVCTGSHTNTTLTGMRTLTHSNASSPHTRYVILDGALAYADACIDKALEMYKLTGIIESDEEPEVETEPEPKVEKTQEELDYDEAKKAKKAKKNAKRSRVGTPGAHGMKPNSAHSRAELEF